MRLLFHALYWPALAVCILCIAINFMSTFIHSLAQEVAEHAEKKLRAHRVRA